MHSLLNLAKYQLLNLIDNSIGFPRNLLALEDGKTQNIARSTFLNDMQCYLGRSSISSQEYPDTDCVVIRIKLPKDASKLTPLTLKEFISDMGALFGKEFLLFENSNELRLFTFRANYCKVASNVAANYQKIENRIRSFESEVLCAVWTGGNTVTPADVGLLEERFAQGPMDSDMCPAIAASLAGGAARG